MYFTGMGTISPLLPRFVKDTMHDGNVIVGLVVAVIAVSAVVVRPFAARLANRRGRRMATTAGALALAVSVALYPFPSLALLIPARLLTGAAEALFFTGALTIVTELAPARWRGMAISYFSVAVYLGLGVGPAIGERVTAMGGLRLGFIAAAAFGAAAALISVRLTETKKGIAAQLDGGAVRRISPVSVLPGCVLALGMVANVTFASFMPLYADQLHTNAAGVYLTYTAVVIAARVFGSRIPDMLGTATCGTVATVMIAIGMGATALSGSVRGLYAGSATMAIGISFLYPALMKLVVDRASDAERATGVATFSAFFDIANGLGGIALGAAASLGGYRASFSTAAVSALLGLVILRKLVLRTSPGEAHER
jgi:MFS family permease